MIDGARWFGANRADPRAAALYHRHYSAQLRRRRAGARDGRQFVAPGAPMVLLTADCSALFVWLRSVEGTRLDGQSGVCCVVFRNEGELRSSDLIREADALADQRWPGERHFTYVDPRALRSEVPGYCFRRAGWRRVGESKSGLLLLERGGAS